MFPQILFNLVCRRSVPVDLSAACTGASQTVSPANTNRRFFKFQNISANPMYLEITGAAATATTSYTVAPGATFTQENGHITTAAITVLGTATNLFVYKEA